MDLLLITSPKGIVEGAKAAIDWILGLIYGDKVPSGVRYRIGIVIFVCFLLVAIWAGLWAFSKIKKLWLDEIWPLFHNAEEKRCAELRRRFADHLHSEIRRLNNLEQWSDHRFAELEAEVEAEGSLNRSFLRLPRRDALRRERSLSHALATSKERLILVEGEPGSGKSVALRHVAEELSRQAATSKRTDSLLPIYVNLKELEKLPEQSVDPLLIRTFVLKALNRVNSRDVEKFLDNNFDNSLREGRWLFLFDSFDELPDILSSVEADATIKAYAGAIADFLGGFNKCRGIIASREFRGPGQLGWPRFRILALTRSRQHTLIKKAALQTNLRHQLLGNLDQAAEAIRAMASNPMFLGLLIEYMQGGNAFPANSHIVFDQYINSRLESDSDKLKKRFNLTPEEVRSAAEVIAFCISADPLLGLSPNREALAHSLEKIPIKLETELFHVLDALEYIKLARSESQLGISHFTLFTFAHRRFQEYFATCTILRNPLLITPTQLLTDGRWREATVVLLQSQDVLLLVPILAEAQKILSTMEPAYESDGSFLWPNRALHLMGLMQDGFTGRMAQLPTAIRSRVDIILQGANASPLLLDAKWSLDVAGPAGDDTMLIVFREAVRGQSQWLQDVAYKQVAKLTSIPDDIAEWIRASLLRLTLGGRLFKNRIEVYAFVSRLSSRPELLSTARFSFWAPVIDLILIMVSALSIPRIPSSGSHPGGMLLSCAVGIFVFSLPFVNYALTSDPDLTPSTYSIRFALTAICIGVLLPSPRSRYSQVWTLICVYTALWLPCAFISIKTGDFTKTFWWPLQPLTPVFRILSRPRHYFSKLKDGAVSAVEDWRDNLKVLGAMLLLVSFAGGAYWIFGTKGFDGLTVLIAAPFFVGLVRLSFYYWKDFLFLRSNAANVKGVSVPAEFLAVIGHFRTGHFRCKQLRRLRQSGIVFDPELERIARLLSVTVGSRWTLGLFYTVMLQGPTSWFLGLIHRKRKKDFNPFTLRDPSGSKTFDAWYDRIAKECPLALQWDSQSTDELNRLIEHLMLAHSAHRVTNVAQVG